MRIHLQRVISSNPEKQTVDLFDEKFAVWNAQETSDNPTIIPDVPYLSPLINDYNLSYIWGHYEYLKSQGNLLPGFIDPEPNGGKSLLDIYGPSFLFGRNFNPAYLKDIHEKYYKGKGTNPKVVSGGMSYRPPEGSLAICVHTEYEGSNIIFVIGFVSLSAFYALYQDIDDFEAPKTQGSTFSPEYQSELYNETGDNIGEIIGVSHDSFGHGNIPYDYGEEDENPIDQFNKTSLIGKHFPVSGSRVVWQITTPAHVENLNTEFIRFKQNEIKRIGDIFNLATSGDPNKALLKTTAEDSSTDTKYRLFSNWKQYNPDKTTLSINNMALDDVNIFDNYVKDSTETSGFAKEFAYEEPVHIAPESGIKMCRDGKLVFYADVYDSFADFNKPTNYDEYFKETSTFYKKTFASGKSEYISNLDSQYAILNGASASETFKYYFRQYKIDNPHEEDSRYIDAFNDRGAYMVIDPSYVELSSDSKKGGYLLEKSSRKYSRAREYEKKVVYSEQSVYRRLLLDQTVTFDHDRAYAWELYGDENIREGTYSVDAPLTIYKSFREYHNVLESSVTEVKGLKNDIYAGLFMGRMSEQGSDTDDGGCIMLRAGTNTTVGGSLGAAQTRPEENKGGRIVLDAHEIVLNANRIMLGQIRIDQRDKMDELNLGSILLAIVPDPAIEKIAHLLFTNNPINVRKALANFSKKVNK
jgi:hypothetical protein